MALGDGIRRNIASVDPAERVLLRDAFIALNNRFFGGSRTDPVAGGVTWWFKQDEIHQATHVHQGPEFLPWHRVIVNRLEALLRQINPDLSLHYWDWPLDPRPTPTANRGGGPPGLLNLFTPDFMGYGGSTSELIGPPWQNASAPWRPDGLYVPGAALNRDSTDNPADPPTAVRRSIVGSPATANGDTSILSADDYADMRSVLEPIHDAMHGFVRMGGQHISFRDPFVFLLHSNVDRLFAQWQLEPTRPGRLDPATVYGTESNLDVMVLSSVQNVTHLVEPWSTGHSHDQFGNEHFSRPWYAPENEGIPFTYKHSSVVAPPCYDTLPSVVRVDGVANPGSVINFNDVPEGETGMRAAVITFAGCRKGFTLEVKPGFGPAAPYSVMTPPGLSVPVVDIPEPYVRARIWFTFTGTTANSVAPVGSVTLRCPQTGDEFPFTLRANTIRRPTAAIVLSLDQSGSMDDPAGTSGARRIEVLREAASRFVEVIQPNNGVGLVRFDHDAYPVNDPTWPGFDVRKIVSDGDRSDARQAVQAHRTNPAGATSVGDGLVMGRDTLSALPATDYEKRALIVLTDGLQNRPRSIEDAHAWLDNLTYAIGLGTADQVDTAALSAAANGTGGYLLLTGHLTPNTDDYFRLSKFFLQILAGVTNSVIVKDPSGFLAPGTKLRIPFLLSDADIESTVILLDDYPVIKLAVETPDGDVLDPSVASGIGGVYAEGTNLRYYRYTLPLGLGRGAHGGTWHALLEIDDDLMKRYAKMKDNKEDLSRFRAHGARYSLVVQGFSNLRMTAALRQSSYSPGATMNLRATLTEYALPLANRAVMHAELVRPDGTTSTIAMAETEPGVFEAAVPASLHGVYQFKIEATGATMRGLGFTREQLLTGGIVEGGGGRVLPPDGRFDRFCELLDCLLDERTGAWGFLKERGLDPERLVRCLREICARQNGHEQLR